MKVVMISEKDKFSLQRDALYKLLQNNNEIKFCNYEYKREEYMSIQKMQELQADFFIIFDLIGMEQVTLTDGVGMNLVDAKILHFLTREKLRNEEVLAKPLSLNMFFYCAGELYKSCLEKKFPDMPYLRSYDREDKEALVTAYREVLHESYSL